ncbi:hypothetical protein ACF3DV_15215 [Chlorogloeopsis fritschii PCC 9212]|uniref:hypothetical protein n=1 Tax=Chlorogloeopsis fritschii TaxID=1124 RepID=UPI0003181052|nr:hypothetical protein [Chlorogloeopsis fritschii]
MRSYCYLDDSLLHHFDEIDKRSLFIYRCATVRSYSDQLSKRECVAHALRSQDLSLGKNRRL